MNDFVRDYQKLLDSAGYAPGPVDGVWGPQTSAAGLAFWKAAGRPRRTGNLPWLDEAYAALGWHEKHDNARLREWLKSDGQTLGDPAKLPWCGDFVHTAIRRALPDEWIDGELRANPYWALNWTHFGREVEPCFGCVVAFKRPGGGHVGFLVGDAGPNWLILGGNQNNTVSETRIAKSRAVAYRWPLTFAQAGQHVPKVSASGAVSRNEA